MAGQAEGEAPNPLHSRTGIPLPWVDQALMSVPSGLVTCCEVNGEEVRAMSPLPTGDQASIPMRRARSATYYEAKAVPPVVARCADRCDAVDSESARTSPTLIADHSG